MNSRTLQAHALVQGPRPGGRGARTGVDGGPVDAVDAVESLDGLEPLSEALSVATAPAAHDTAPLLDELCPGLFASLARVDQRRKGALYLRGLLEAPGRKSMRNIASVLGGRAAEQSLHHFITCSTWDWAPVRQALALQLARISPPRAWVLRPMVIPKAGQHTVGVDRRFVSDVGQMLNAQHAVGVWAADEQLSFPVNWRLHLPDSWLDDAPRRSAALIPDWVDTETLGECAAEAVLGLPERWGLPRRPVVVDARDHDVPRLVRRLRAQGMPVLARVSGSLPLLPATPPGASVRRRGVEPQSVEQLMNAALNLRRPALWPDHVRGEMRTSLAAAMPVHLAVQRAAGPRPTLLAVGAGALGRGGPTEFWITDLADVAVPMLLRLGHLLDRVDADFRRLADRVGLRDFTGRSFGGWHRHMTLASAAYAVAALTAPQVPSAQAFANRVETGVGAGE